jgi:dimethylargininase
MVGTALVRRPGPRLQEGELTHIERASVDPELAAAQHAEYRELLARSGWHVHEVEPADDLPDAAFVEEDGRVLLDDRVVLTRPGHPARREEVATVAAALAQLGVPCVDLPGTGTLDGGDVLRVGRRLYVGSSSRTDEAGIEAFASLAAEDGLEVVPVPVHDHLHLKTGATALPDGTIVAVPALREAFAGRFVLGVPEPAGANVLALGAGAVAVAASAVATAELLRDRELTVETVDISQFERVEAGMTCLSVLLPGVLP